MADEDLYGGEYPEEGYEDGLEDMQTSETSAELVAMKQKLKDMEEEAARLRELQNKVAGEASGTGGGVGGGAAGGGPDAAAREEADSRSVYVGNVDYGTQPEELQIHFQNCGTVNRVTILSDKFGNPKGFAYVEFLEVDAVQNAVQLADSELRGRKITVAPKRTNVPGMRARGRGGRRGGFGRGGGFMMAPYGMPYGMMPMPMPYGMMPYGGRGGRRGGRGGRGGGRFAPY